MDVWAGRFLQANGDRAAAYTDFVAVFLLMLLLVAVMLLVLWLGHRQKRHEAPRLKELLEKRLTHPDSFRKTYGYSWDTVFVFKIRKLEVGRTLTPFQKAHDLDHMAAILHEKGLQCRPFYSIQQDEVYCKIRGPLEVLKRHAHEIEYKVKLDPTILSETMKRGRPDKGWTGIDLDIKHIMTSLKPYDHIYVPFHETAGKEAHFQYPNNTCFRDIDRILLIESLLLADKGGVLDPDELKAEDVSIGYFALHDMHALRKVERKWLFSCSLPWMLSVDPIKDYFGTKIGLYVVWQKHLTLWLLPAAVVGVLTWINVANNNNDPNAPDIPYFAGFIALWSTLVLEFWKREESHISMKWGTSEFEDNERERPSFYGHEFSSPIDGSPGYKHFTELEFATRQVATGMIVCGVVLSAAIVLLSLFLVGIILRESGMDISGFGVSGVFIALLQSMLMFIFDRLYMMLIPHLTAFENHRTETQHEDAMIAKCFVFRYVINYIPMFYIAFVKPYIQEFEECALGSCMEELKVSLATIYLSKMVLNTSWGVALPLLKAHLNRQANLRGVREDKEGSMTEVEREFMRPDYEEFDGIVNDYAESVILFGFTTMFISAFPLATFLAFLYSFVEAKIYAWKLCHVYRRPQPKTAQDMGTWYWVLEMISVSAVLTNAGIVAFTGEFVAEYTANERIWVFVGMSTLIFLAKYLVATAIPDVPHEVNIQLKRQEFITRKLIHNEVDERIPSSRRKSNEGPPSPPPTVLFSPTESRDNSPDNSPKIQARRHNSSTMNLIKQGDMFTDLLFEQSPSKAVISDEFMTFVADEKNRPYPIDPDHRSPVEHVDMGAAV